MFWWRISMPSSPTSSSSITLIMTLARSWTSSPSLHIVSARLPRPFKLEFSAPELKPLLSVPGEPTLSLLSRCYSTMTFLTLPTISPPLYPSVFNQAGQKVQPSTITINFSFISSSSSPLIIPLALPTSSFPHLCSQFHSNFLRLLLPPQTYDSKYLCIPYTRLNLLLWRGLYDPASFLPWPDKAQPFLMQLVDDILASTKIKNRQPRSAGWFWCCLRFCSQSWCHY